MQSIIKVVRAYKDGDLRERLEKYHGENIENAFGGWANVWHHRPVGFTLFEPTGQQDGWSLVSTCFIQKTTLEAA